MISKYTIYFMRIILIAFIPVFFSCSENDSFIKEDVVLTINNFAMSKSEFKNQCAVDVEYNEKFKTSTTAKQEMLDGIIRKELLIQEAKKMGLDKDTKFISAIERYWEATLIKLLIEQKNNEIQKSTLVSESEILKKYETYKLKNSALPGLDTIKNELAAQILESKKTQVLENWIESLQKKAKIKIDDEIFTE